jgi:hypothetical protein
MECELVVGETFLEGFEQCDPQRFVSIEVGEDDARCDQLLKKDLETG